MRCWRIRRTSHPADAAGRAVQLYHELLSHGTVAEDSAALLDAGQRARRLVFGTRPLCVALRPNLITRSRFRRIRAAAQGVLSALSTLERAVLDDPALRAELALQPEEERLALAPPGCGLSSPASRLDAFVQDGVRFMEFNAESPAGMAYQDRLADVFETLPVMRLFRRHVRVRRLPVAEHQVDAMLAAYAQWGGRDQPVVAIVDWLGLPTVAEFELFVAAFAARGIEAFICEPKALERRGGALLLGERRITLVYRRVLASELLARGEEGRAMIDAYLNREACVVNTFRAKLLHKKLSLALLSDDRYAHLYTPSQRAAITAHIPWTRRVQDGPSTKDGHSVPDLIRYVLDHKEALVLKPNDDYGGHGVTLG
ncbi:MAG TPA: hypothetical protein VFA70_03595, partial [Dehalococcoidia bacterium]|nr:hypothetical protein [Dehalococcoidia bacterium]